MYSLGEEWKRHQLAEDEAQEGTATAIKSYGMPLSPVTFFKNLGRVLLALDKDWPEVVRNLHRARQNWSLLPLLGRPKLIGIFTKRICCGSGAW